MQDFVNGEAFHPFSEEPTEMEINFQICWVAIAVEKLLHRRHRKNYDASTNQSNNFGVSRKRFKPSTPGSTDDDNSLWAMSSWHSLSTLHDIAVRQPHSALAAKHTHVCTLKWRHHKSWKKSWWHGLVTCRRHSCHRDVISVSDGALKW